MFTSGNEVACCHYLLSTLADGGFLGVGTTCRTVISCILQASCTQGTAPESTGPSGSEGRYGRRGKGNMLSHLAVSPVADRYTD
jgi:hypothetical protein